MDLAELELSALELVELTGSSLGFGGAEEPGVIGNLLLQESGSFLLQESNSRLELE